MTVTPWGPVEWPATIDATAIDVTADDSPHMSTWARIDLAAFTGGNYAPPRAELMPRTDGVCLLYRGLVHSIHGESESGKSWIAQAEVARVLRAGGRALYVDHESDPASVVGRLLELGVTRDEILDGFDYRRPESSPRTVWELPAWEDMLCGHYDLAVIDGVTDSLGMWGAKSTDNDEVAGWLRAFPRQLAQRTGAAVVLIDHVTKNAETRGRFAIGGQAKMAGLDGAAYVVDVVEPLGRGLRGVLSLRIAKDRPGGIRGHAGEMQKNDRTQEVAWFILDGTGDALTATVEVPEDGPREFRPTILMKRVSDFLTASPGATGRAINAGIQGKAEHIRTAVAKLVEEGNVRTEKQGQATLHHLVRPFDETKTPDRVPASHRVPTASQEPRPASPPLKGGRGRARGETPQPRPCDCNNAEYGLHRPECPVDRADPMDAGEDR